MSEVDPDHAARLQAHHEVVQVPVSDAQDPVADAQERVGAGKVVAESQEGLGAGAHLQEGPPAGGQPCGLCPLPSAPSPREQSREYSYFKRSAGTLLSLFLKDVTVSVRLAPL